VREGRFAAISLVTMWSMCGTEIATAKEPPRNFVQLSDVAPTIRQDIRYASSRNFTGRPVPGYSAPQCWLRQETAEALAAAQREAAASGLSLVVYDCYRPLRATEAFVAWAGDASDQAMKAAYYPRVDKSVLFERGYISKVSMHSTGVAVDLALAGLDFGTTFDFFDEVSATNYPGLGAEPTRNRALPTALMQRHGFENYPGEWWHFSFKNVKDAAPCDFDLK
jgi:zinc D-Ala-D-Ala dipeptidase